MDVGSHTLITSNSKEESKIKFYFFLRQCKETTDTKEKNKKDKAMQKWGNKDPYYLYCHGYKTTLN